MRARVREPPRRGPGVGRRGRLPVLAGRDRPARRQPVDLAAGPADGRRRAAGRSTTTSARWRFAAAAAPSSRWPMVSTSSTSRAAASSSSQRVDADQPRTRSERRQMRSPRTFFRRRHGRQRGAEDLRPVAARPRSVASRGSTKASSARTARAGVPTTGRSTWPTRSRASTGPTTTTSRRDRSRTNGCSPRSGTMPAWPTARR